MVYLLHFSKPVGHIRHLAGATSDRLLATELYRNDVSRLQTPIVVAAREQGVVVTVARTWWTMYTRVDELPHSRSRAKLCGICIAAQSKRRRA